MKALIDDTGYTVQIDGEEFQFPRPYGYMDFDKSLTILLTNSQFWEYVMVDTKRTFRVSKKRVEAFKKYFKGIKEL